MRRGGRQRAPLAELVSLRGQTALVTGAASGIGRAIAWRFAEAGAGLYLVDVKRRELGRVVAEAGELGASAEPFVVDLGDAGAIESLWGELAGREPDVLVNNAGAYPLRDFLEEDEAFVEGVLAVNLLSTMRMSRAMIRTRGKRGGTIVNVGSIEAVLPFKSEVVSYGVSKAGVLALTRTLASEYARSGFKINALVPGGVLTPGTARVARTLRNLRPGLVRDAIGFADRVPAGRVGRPDDVALMALVLACGLSDYVHGALVPVDGGFLSA